MPDDLVLRDPWWDLRAPGDAEQQQTQAVSNELLREVSPGHPLYGLAVTVIARSEAHDDVLVKVGSRWALVHLTWSGQPETPPWPTCTIFGSATDVERATALD
ncbi:hypothetical protein [Micromonospora lupini]|uniref:Uncharacterized protein n=1 Tax=Micromonospora lupini str. Lupac 08 TaxID=1150864 RepID=I0KZG7_9ACTN|nr:hypothetical protein [Micromonospora lupini]CCH16964.1 conserved hypothetical protein [Micromonospora lupini str. Lupac 08]